MCIRTYTGKYFIGLLKDGELSPAKLFEHGDDSRVLRDVWLHGAEEVRVLVPVGQLDGHTPIGNL